MTERWTVLSILRTTTGFLEERGVSEPRLSAELLLASVLGCRRLDLYLRYDRPLSDPEISRYRSLVKRRLANEPVQYITGSAGFRGLDLAVDPRVLVPRPETERLVAEVLEWADAETRHGRAPAKGWRMIDFGTGSGAIACSLALELEAVGWMLGVDRSAEALCVARANAARVGAAATRWLVADSLESVHPRMEIDAIVSNPPYVAESDRSGLPREVVDWEPAGALFAGPRGTEAIARLIREAGPRLRNGGLLAIEIGAGQSSEVQRLVETASRLDFLTVFRDYSGVERGVLALARD